jgi:hypothetical protein
MMYGISGCITNNSNWTTLAGLKQDVANFLLLRGDHAYLTAGWAPCADYIGWDAELFDADYGQPTDEVCHEAAPGVFVREWSRATIEMDCNSWTPTISFKGGV